MPNKIIFQILSRWLKTCQVIIWGNSWHGSLARIRSMSHYNTMNIQDTQYFSTDSWKRKDERQTFSQKEDETINPFLLYPASCFFNQESVTQEVLFLLSYIFRSPKTVKELLSTSQTKRFVSLSLSILFQVLDRYWDVFSSHLTFGSIHYNKYCHRQQHYSSCIL